VFSRWYFDTKVRLGDTGSGTGLLKIGRRKGGNRGYRVWRVELWVPRGWSAALFRPRGSDEKKGYHLLPRVVKNESWPSRQPGVGTLREIGVVVVARRHLSWKRRRGEDGMAARTAAVSKYLV